MKILFPFLFFTAFFCACSHLGGYERADYCRIKVYDAVHKDRAGAAAIERLIAADFALTKAEGEEFFLRGLSAGGESAAEVLMSETADGVVFKVCFYNKGSPVRRGKPYEDFFSDMDKDLL